MALFLGNKEPSEIYLGGKAISEIYLGASLIYANLKEIYKDGVLMAGATLSNFEQSATDIFLNVGGGLQSGPFDRSQTGYVRFDMTKYNTITVRGTDWCYGYSGSHYYARLGIDTGTGAGSVELPHKWRGTWGNEGEPATFEEVFDVSALIGQHTVAAYARTDNVSNYYPGYTQIHITEIIGGR